MELTREGKQEARDVMKNNLEIVRKNRYLSKDKKAELLHSSFWNYLLRFITIDGEKYPTNSKKHIRGGLFLRYTNPHEEDIRVSYNEEKQVLFIEKKEMVRHPFLVNQRVTGDMACLCSFFGYETFGYTDPNAKVPEWKKVGEEIPLSKIISLRIKSFWDRPKAIWREGEDYTAYEIIVRTKNSTTSKGVRS